MLIPLLFVLFVPVFSDKACREMRAVALALLLSVGKAFSIYLCVTVGEWVRPERAGTQIVAATICWRWRYLGMFPSPASSRRLSVL